MNILCERRLSGHISLTTIATMILRRYMLISCKRLHISVEYRALRVPPTSCLSYLGEDFLPKGAFFEMLASARS